jgi:hypothetical protein
MELLDRYLQAVRKHLPWKRQEDIIAELRANLESQLDEKQEELGRPLTPAEAEAWIKQLGSPLQMASHYQGQQYLIGPAVFPAYLNVLRLASTWAVVVFVLVSAVDALVGTANSGAALGKAVLQLPFVLVQVAAWVTLVFAAIEFAAARFPDKCPSFATFGAKWSPRDLPRLEPEAIPGRKRRTYAMAMTEVAFGFVILGWLLAVPKHPYLIFGPGEAFLQAFPYQLAPIWMTAYWWIVGLNAVQLAWRCIDLLRGTWQKSAGAQHIVSKLIAIIPLVILANVRDQLYVLLKRPELDLPQYGQKLTEINQNIHTVILILCVIVCAQLAWDIAQAVIAAARKRAAVS